MTQERGDGQRAGPPLLGARNLRLFARGLPLLVFAAAVGQVGGSIAGGLTRGAFEALGGRVSLVANNLVILLVMVVLMGPIVSRWYVGRMWSLWEWAVAFVSAAISLRLTPAIYSASRDLLGQMPSANDPGQMVSIADVAGVAAVAIVLLPGIYFFWVKSSAYRVRFEYNRLLNLVEASDPNDPTAARQAKAALALMHHQATARTERLVAAISLFFGGRASGANTDESIRGRLTDEIVAVYGVGSVKD